MEKIKLTDLRNALEEVMGSIAKTGDGHISNTGAIAMLRSQHGDLIEKLALPLIDIALTKLANEVGNRKGPRVPMDAGIDLFGSYPGIPKTISLARGVKKTTLQSTFSEADRWVDEHKTKAIVNTEKNEGFKKLLDKYRPYAMSDGDTIEDAIRRKSEKDGGLFKQ